MTTVRLPHDALAARVTRAEFKAAVEKGIAGAPLLTTEERNALRLVALTATEALTGIFLDSKGCGCPLTQAGFFHRQLGLGSGEDSIRLRAFYRGYDDSFPVGIRKIEVID